MTAYYDEPTTAAELMSRYREVKRRLYPIPARPLPRESTLKDAEGILSFVVALTGALIDRTQQSERNAEALKQYVSLDGPAGKAHAALRAVAKRTGVPIDAILGRRRMTAIASARHEAVWWAALARRPVLRRLRPCDRASLDSSDGNPRRARSFSLRPHGAAIRGLSPRGRERRDRPQAGSLPQHAQ